RPRHSGATENRGGSVADHVRVRKGCVLLHGQLDDGYVTPHRLSGEIVAVTEDPTTGGHGVGAVEQHQLGVDLLGGGQPLLLSFVGDAYRFRGHRDRIVVDQCVPVFQCALVTVSHVGVEGSGKGHVVLGDVVLSRRGAPARVGRRGVHQTHVALPEGTHHFTVVQDAQPRDGEQDPQVSFLASPLGQGSQEFVQVGGPSGEEDGVVVRGAHVEGHAAEQTCLRGIPQRGADVLLGVPGGEPAEVLFVGPTQRGDEQVGVVVVV